MAPPDEVIDGLVEKREDFVDDPGGFGRAQSTRADEVRNQLAEFGLIRHGRAVCLGGGHGPTILPEFGQEFRSIRWGAASGSDER